MLLFCKKQKRETAPAASAVFTLFYLLTLHGSYYFFPGLLQIELQKNGGYRMYSAHTGGQGGNHT